MPNKDIFISKNFSAGPSISRNQTRTETHVHIQIHTQACNHTLIPALRFTLKLIVTFELMLTLSYLHSQSDLYLSLHSYSYWVLKACR